MKSSLRWQIITCFIISKKLGKLLVSILHSNGGITETSKAARD